MGSFWKILGFICVISGCKFLSGKNNSARQEIEAVVETESLDSLSAFQEHKINAQDLKMLRFNVSEITLGENIFPMLNFEAVSDADYIEYKACDSSAQCFSGSLYTVNHIVPGLKPGLTRLAVRACVHENRAAQPNNLCGEWKESLFLQKPPLKDRLDEFLAKKLLYQDKIKKLGEPFIKALKSYEKQKPLCHEKIDGVIITSDVVKKFLIIGPELVGIGFLDPEAKILVDINDKTRLVLSTRFEQLYREEEKAEEPAPKIIHDSGGSSRSNAMQVGVVAGALTFIIPLLAKQSAVVAAREAYTSLYRFRTGDIDLPSSATTSSPTRVYLGLSVVALVAFTTVAIMSHYVDVGDVAEEVADDLFLAQPTPCETLTISLRLIHAVQNEVEMWKKKISVVDVMLQNEFNLAKNSNE